MAFVDFVSHEPISGDGGLTRHGNGDMAECPWSVECGVENCVYVTSESRDVV